jgi:hypothetical protein
VRILDLFRVEAPSVWFKTGTGETCFIYPLGFLNKTEGVFFPSYSAFNGANFDDFTLLDTESPCFWTPLPTIEIGNGWKSNCLMASNTSAT